MKGINLRKYVIDLAMHALEIGPRKSKENRKEYGGEHIFGRLAYGY
jgi:hypothetical protein